MQFLVYGREVFSYKTVQGVIYSAYLGDYNKDKAMLVK